MAAQPDTVTVLREFDGEGGKKFKEWLKEVERAGVAIGTDDERFKSFTLQFMKDVAADFAVRIIEQMTNQQ